MRPLSGFLFLSLIAAAAALSMVAGGCAQVGTPSGGIKDTLAPRLVKASPAPNAVNVQSNKITFEFDEYIDVQDIVKNLLISPAQGKIPSVISNPKSITLKFRDSLLPNTTYNINFGDAIHDINEGNILRNFTYVFSTGSRLDSLTLSGRVVLAETGIADSLMMVYLYKDLADSAVQKRKPDYITRVDKEGDFTFHNLPEGNFNIYALKDGDGGKTYNGKSELFAFSDRTVNPSLPQEDITLFAFEEQKKADAPAGKPGKPEIYKKLAYSLNLQQRQDLLQPLTLTFNNALKEIDSSLIYLTDTNFVRMPGIRYSLDSTAKTITLRNKWQAENYFKLIVDKASVKDSAGTALAKTDTVSFATKGTEEYARITLRFNNIDLSQNPLLQFISGDKVALSYPVTGREWSDKLFPPGEYVLRILYDTDKNGVWTPGNYAKKRQPETAVTLPQRLSVRADWDNERDINL